MKFLSCLALVLLLTACATAPQDPTPVVESATLPRDTGIAHSAARAAARSPLSVIVPASLPKNRDVTELALPRDLWERIRRGYAIPNIDGDLVHDREQWYVARPDYIARMTERSSKYLYYVVEELEHRHMPTELALLPFIESAFNPQAISTAQAVGMWQFVPATGRTFDLKQNLFRDDRRDVLASTRAALDYLQKLYTMFGDWQLALAAYNWGEGNVQRAIARNQRAGLGTGYLDLSMPMETRMYVPKLQAVKNLVADPKTMGVNLPEIPNHPYFQQVPITRDIDVVVAARLAEVEMEDFKALNPSANRPVILAAGTPQILLPWDNATVFQENLEAFTGGRLASWTAWIAPHTMKAAEAARLVGMSEAELCSINRIPARMLVKAGSTLVVPRGANRVEDVAPHVADNAQLSLAPEIVLHRTAVRARRGDTVTSLARRYNVSVGSVLEWNHLAGRSTLRQGEQVTLFLPVRASVAEARRAEPARGTRRVATTAKAAPRKQQTRVAPLRAAVARR